MSELSHYIKLRSGLSGCDAKLFECDKYLDCDSCLEDKIKEHDKQIRADAINDFRKEICKMITQSENDGNYRFYAAELKQAIADLAEQLKEQNKWL